MSIQESITKVREKIFNHRREVAVRLKHARQADEEFDKQLELLLDEVCFHTGLKPTKENLPLLGTYIAQVLKDRHKQSSDLDEFE